MEHIPSLIIDLALLLTVAAVATILCKRLKQPLILGYVLAGLLVGPAISWIPNITDGESISTWSEIGVIFLMFGLGLEFSIMKLTRVGKPGIITALTEMTLIVAAGFLCGTLMGWSFFTSLFLGGMLASSSTTIIVKAFDELGIKGKSFTGLVFGTLVIEDIVVIFLMVVLSTIAVGTAIDGGAILAQVGQMALYLIIWFVLSVLLVPTFFKKVSRVLNDEILLVASIALCLLMVALANAIGFSAALGAFMAGSILAGTIQVHRIEKLTKPIKDLFGAVFFVSVGMLVSPQMILNNIIPILVITVVTLLGKPLFTALGALLGRQSLKTSIQASLSLSQIGEFSFIVAALGVSLGVTADFLYPVIVAVSVLTTLTTPFYIKNSEKVYGLVKKIFPQSLQDRIETRTQPKERPKGDVAWVNYLKHWFIKMLLVVLAAFASVVILSELLRPLMLTVIPSIVTEFVITGIALIVIGVFISNLFFSARKGDFASLWIGSKRHRLILLLLIVFDILISGTMLVYAVVTLEGANLLFVIAPALLLALFFARSKRIHTTFLRFENLFIRNLNEETLAGIKPSHNDDDPVSWVETQLAVTTVVALHWRELGNRRLSAELMTAHGCNVDLISIRRNGHDYGSSFVSRLTREGLRGRTLDSVNMLLIQEGDELTFLGTEAEIDAFIKAVVKACGHDEEKLSRSSLSEYFAGDERSENVRCLRLKIEQSSEFKGKTIAATRLRENYGCLVVAIEHQSLFKLRPSRNTRVLSDDYVWVFGRNSDLQELLNDHVSPPNVSPPKDF